MSGPKRVRDRAKQNEANRKWRQRVRQTDEWREKKAAADRAYRARKKAAAPPREPKPVDPAKIEHRRAQQREYGRRYRAKYPERVAAYEAGRKDTKAAQSRARYDRMVAAGTWIPTPYKPVERRPAGLLANAAPSPWAAVLARLTRAAGRTDDADEIAAEAAALVVEGMDEAGAIREARRLVRQNAKFLRFSAVEYREMN